MMNPLAEAVRPSPVPLGAITLPALPLLPSKMSLFLQANAPLRALLTLGAVLGLLVAQGCAANVSAGGSDAEANSADIQADTGTTPPGTDTGSPATPLLPAGPDIELVTNTAYYLRGPQVIQTAQTRLDIVQFETSWDPTADNTIKVMVESAIAAAKRGVVVRVLLDEGVAANAPLVKYLNDNGVSAKLDSAAIRTHTKLILSDQAALFGSTNWSYTSVMKNNETNVLVRNATARAAIGKYADALWTNSGKPAKTTYDAKATIGIYADHQYATVVGPLIDAAKTRIILGTYGMNIDMTDSSADVTKTVKKLQAAVTRGVKVQTLLDLSPDGTAEGNDINAASGAILKGIGVEVRNDPASVITHAKYLIVDNDVVLGSNNWGYLGFVDDHELGVHTTDAKVLSGLVAYFQGIWSQSTPL